MGTITRRKQQGAGTSVAMPECRFSTLLLAGGRSSRMGQAKAAMRFGSSTILERLIAELEPVSEELIVMAAPLSDETFAIDKLFGDWRQKVRLIRDEVPFAGPVAALVRGLRAACSPVVFVCSCDLPLLRAGVAKALCATLGEYDGVVPEIDGTSQPLCAAYKKEAADKIDALWRNGEARVTAIVEKLNRRRVTEAELRVVDPDLRSFLNLNTPEDYHRALAIAGLAN